MKKLFYALLILFIVSCSTDEDYLREQGLNDQVEPISRSISPMPEDIMEFLFDNVDLDETDRLTVERYLIFMWGGYDRWYIPVLGLIHDNPIANMYRGVIPYATFQAAYQPNLNTIIWFESAAISQNVLYEELIHAGQDRVYPGGIYQYAKAPGTPNIEFEAKLVMDMVNCLMDYPFSSLGVEGISQDYDKWVMELCYSALDNPFFPTMEEVVKLKINGNGFYELCKYYGESRSQYNYDVLTTLRPMLIYYMNNKLYNN